MSKKTAVIGLGNTLRRDDGIGIVVLESLLRLYKRDEVDYLNFGIASFDLVYRLEKYDTALLIDAIDGSFEPATLKIFEPKNIDFPLKPRVTSSHELNLTHLIHLCSTFAAKTKVYIAGIQINDVSYQEGLSEALKAKQESLTREIDAFIASLITPGVRPQ